MNDRKLARLLGEAVELLDRAQVALPDRLGAMRDAMADSVTAARLDGDRTTGHTTVLDEHGWPVPAVADPTGEAAIRPDVAAQDRRDLVDAVRSIGRQAELVVRILARHTPRPASDPERAAAEGRRPLAGSDCQACGRFVSGSSSDRLRSNYCQACFRAWLREGRPERAVFERDRREATQQEEAS